jgi:hypothetical protein
MPGQESLIKISAMPNFKLNNDSLKLDDAVYLWSRNKNRILNVGGYAKDSIVIEHNKLRSTEEITVDVSDVGNGIKAQKSISIPISNPQIHWYVRDEFNYRRLQSIDRGLRVASGDVNLIAEPYFFSTTKGTQGLTFDWKINNETVYLDPNSPKHELTVHNPGQDGQAIFNVSVKNPKTFLQTAGNTVSLYFQSIKK